MQKINAFAALAFCTDFNLFKVRLLLEHSCVILSSFKIVFIFNHTAKAAKSGKFEVANSSGQLCGIDRF